MKYKHDENENFALDFGDIAVPVELSDNDATVYRIAEDAFLSWNVNFGAALFSESSKKALTEALIPVMNRYGFHPADDIGTTLMLYQLKKEDATLEANSNVIILKAPQEIAKYDFDSSLHRIDINPENGRDVICCRILEEKIVAFAAVNDFSDEEYPEICVECSPNYRSHGYASSCAYALAKYLMTACGEKAVSYVCKLNNISSCKTAEKAGFKFTGHRIPFVFYRNSDKKQEETENGI